MKEIVDRLINGNHGQEDRAIGKDKHNWGELRENDKETDK